MTIEASAIIAFTRQEVIIHPLSSARSSGYSKPLSEGDNSPKLVCKHSCLSMLFKLLCCFSPLTTAFGM